MCQLAPTPYLCLGGAEQGQDQEEMGRGSSAGGGGGRCSGDAVSPSCIPSHTSVASTSCLPLQSPALPPLHISSQCCFPLASHPSPIATYPSARSSTGHHPKPTPPSQAVILSPAWLGAARSNLLTPWSPNLTPMLPGFPWLLQGGTARQGGRRGPGLNCFCWEQI